MAQVLEPFRVWQTRADGVQPEGEPIRILSYNILASSLALPADYRNTEPQYLAWDYRKLNLFEEMRLWNADVICLQEVDDFAYFEAQFAHIGYAGVFKKRTGDKLDGCAMFWRLSRLHLVCHHTLEYRVSRFLDRDNVALIAQFSTRGSVPQEFLVATTHLLYNPRRGDIKLGQLQLLFEAVQYLRGTRALPVIVCGDFNLTPSSSLYSFIRDGSLHTAYPWDARAASGQEPYQPLPPRPLPANECDIGLRTLHHQLALASAAAACGGEPPFTSVDHRDQRMTVDYIWYSRDSADVVAVAGPLRPHAAFPGFPNAVFSSDHLALCADVVLRPSAGPVAGCGTGTGAA